MSLYERYRPKEWAQIVGQDAAKEKIAFIRQHGGIGGNCFFLIGPSGSGKTTIARLLASEVADDMATEERKATKADTAFLDEMERRYWQHPLGGRGWAAIVKEVHALRKAQIVDLLGATEPPDGLPSHFVWIFTTTTDGAGKLFEDYDDATPFASRCHEINLTPRGVCKPMAERLVAIARDAGLLNGHPDMFYVPRAERLAKECRNNWRMAIQEVQAGYLTKGGAE